MLLFFLVVTLAVCCLAAFFMLSYFFGLILTGGVPFISTGKKNFDAILTSVKVKPNETVYDLGCGKAHFLIYAAKKYGTKGVGYEISLWPYLWARLNVFLNRVPVKIYFKNFFSSDLTSANVVFCYLFPEVMGKLESKFALELKKGSRVVTYGFHLPNIKPAQNVGRVFVYEF